MLKKFLLKKNNRILIKNKNLGKNTIINFDNKKLILLNSFKFKLLERMIKLKENNKVSIPAFVEDYIKTFDTFEDVYSFIINALTLVMN